MEQRTTTPKGIATDTMGGCYGTMAVAVVGWNVRSTMQCGNKYMFIHAQLEDARRRRERAQYCRKTHRRKAHMEASAQSRLGVAVRGRAEEGRWHWSRHASLSADPRAWPKWPRGGHAWPCSRASKASWARWPRQAPAQHFMTPAPGAPSLDLGAPGVGWTRWSTHAHPVAT